MVATVNGQVDVSTPVLHSLAIKGARPWVDVTAYGILPTNTGATNDARWVLLVATLVDGDTIFFPRGTYQFATTPTITGLSRITVLCYGKAAILQQMTAGQGGLSITGTSVTVQGLTLLGPNTLGDSSIATELGLLVSGGHASISDCWVTQFGYYGIVANAAESRVDQCVVVGTGQIAQSSAHSGIVVAGGKSIVSECRIDNYAIGASSSAASTTYSDNYVNQAATPTQNIDTGLYANGRYVLVRGNHVWGSIKISYTADTSIIANNVLNAPGSSLWLTYSNGGVVDGNVLNGGGLALGADENDRLLRPYNTIFSRNSFLATPHGNDGAVISGVVSGACAGCTFDGNMMLLSGGPAIVLYDAGAINLKNNVIQNNTFRKVGIFGGGTYSAIKLGSGFGEDISGCRVINNTVESNPAITSAGVMVTNGSALIGFPGTAAVGTLEAEKFLPGDAIADNVGGTVIPAGTKVLLVGQYIYPTGGSGYFTGGTAGILMTNPATSSGTVTLVRYAAQIAYGLDLSNAGNSTNLEVWGNNWGTPVSGNVYVGSAVHTFLPMRVYGGFISEGAIAANNSPYQLIMSSQASQASTGAAPKKISDTANGIGLLIIISSNTGETAMFILKGSGGSQLLAPTGGNWSAAFDNAATFNVYRSGSDGKYYIQNKDTDNGASGFNCMLFGNMAGGAF